MRPKTATGAFFRIPVGFIPFFLANLWRDAARSGTFPIGIAEGRRGQGLRVCDC